MNHTLYPFYRILLFATLLSWNILPAQAWYIGEEEFAAATLHNGELSHYNYAFEQDVVNLITTSIEPNTNLRPIISLELTNRNCREEKSYPVYHRDSLGKKITHKVHRPEWGVLWGYRDAQNYHAVLLRTGERDPQGYNPPALQYCILTVDNGNICVHSPWTNTSTGYLNPEEAYNHLLIRPVDGGFEIVLGEEREYRLGFCQDDRLFGNQAGIYVGSGANIMMRNWSITAQKYTERAPHWNSEQIRSHLSKSSNPYEGIYEIATSSSSSYNVRLGGQYRMAFIHDGNDYKLLYLDGAQRAADLWKPGMIKAILQPIDGGEIFRVTWYDVNHNPISENVRATISPKKFSIIFLSSLTQISLIRVSPNIDSLQKKNEGPFKLL